MVDLWWINNKLNKPFILLYVFLVTSGPGTPDSVEGMNQHVSPESSRKAYCRTWEQPSQSASFTHMAQSPSVFNEHSTNSNMASGTVSHNLKSPAVSRSRSVSDSSVPQKGEKKFNSTTLNHTPLCNRILSLNLKGCSL